MRLLIVILFLLFLYVTSHYECQGKTFHDQLKLYNKLEGKMIFKILFIKFQCKKVEINKLSSVVKLSIVYLNKIFNPLDIYFNPYIIEENVCPFNDKDYRNEILKIQKEKYYNFITFFVIDLEKEEFAGVIRNDYNRFIGDAYGILHFDRFKFSPSTFTHEVGHYFGLQHTFAGTTEAANDKKCQELYEDDTKDGIERFSTGDFVYDTKATPINDKNDLELDLKDVPDPCNKRDPNVKWINQRDNFMTYNYKCRYQFTTGQHQRMICYIKNGLTCYETDDHFIDYSNENIKQKVNEIIESAKTCGNTKYADFLKELLKTEQIKQSVNVHYKNPTDVEELKKIQFQKNLKEQDILNFRKICKMINIKNTILDFKEKLKEIEQQKQIINKKVKEIKIITQSNNQVKSNQKPPYRHNFKTTKVDMRGIMIKNDQKIQQNTIFNKQLKIRNLREDRFMDLVEDEEKRNTELKERIENRILEAIEEE